MRNNWVKEIQERTKNVPISGGKTTKYTTMPSFDDFIFAPGQLAKRPVDYFKEEISSKTIIGKSCKKPVKIENPIIFGGMSFGALSKEAKIALAKASSLAGTIANTGEGGMLEDERKYANKLIAQYSTGRFGISEETLKKADIIEIKIGQGAKPGQGGLLCKGKLTDEIAMVRGVSKEKDIHSPAYHKDIKNKEDLKERVSWLREVSGGVPIVLKLAAGNIEDDLKIAVFADPDVISFDGTEGGTGAAPEVMINEVGLPSIVALAKARRFLDKNRARQELWIGGGLVSGGDFAKALAIGADAVFVGFPLLVAMGCVYCKMCYLGKCPKGVATQDPELRKNLDVEDASIKISNYIKNSTEEIKMISGAVGEDDIHKLNKSHIFALNRESSKITGIKHISE